jgi:AcrR family transcriptional regulator
MPTSTKQRPKRLTREEQQAQTRSRLLDAAESLFIASGFHGTSVEEIAERAGYTRGAFYSNFDDKDDIFFALLDRNLSTRIDEISSILRKAPTLADGFAVIRRGNTGRDIRTWSILHAEFWLYAMRNPAARPRLAEVQRKERRAYARAIRAQFAALGMEPPASLEDSALVLQILDEGAPRQRFIDPDEVRVDFFFDAVLMLLEATLALARERERQVKSGSRPRSSKR